MHAGIGKLLGLWIVFAALPGCAPQAKPTVGSGTVTVYVAASTQQTVEEIARKFKAETGIAVEINSGPSSRLAKQISEGGPADLFLSADQANVDYLHEKKLIAKKRNLLGNRLVVVVPSDSPLKLASLADLGTAPVKQVALALEKVPAGEYAREALTKAGVWENIKGKVIGGEDVRATLALVEHGADAGIVYRTDTLGNSRVRVALEVDEKLHKRIEYPLVLIQRETMREEALKFYNYLGSNQSAEVFQRAGFGLLK